MKLPEIPYSLSTTNLTQVSFSSLDETPSCKDGAIKDMKDICAPDFPFLSVRKSRTTYLCQSPGTILAAGFSDGFYYVRNHNGTSYFYFGGVLKGSWSDVDAKQKKCIELNRYICIFPDNVYYRKADTNAISEYKKSHDCETVYDCCLLLRHTDKDSDIAHAGESRHSLIRAYGEQTLYYANAFCNYLGNTEQSHQSKRLFGKHFFEGDEINIFRTDSDVNTSESYLGIRSDKSIKIKSLISSQSTNTEFFTIDGHFLYSGSLNDFPDGGFLKAKRAVPEKYLDCFGSMSEVFTCSEICVENPEADDGTSLIFITHSLKDLKFERGGYLYSTDSGFFGESVSDGGIIEASPCIYGLSESITAKHAGASVRIIKEAGGGEFAVINIGIIFDRSFIPELKDTAMTNVAWRKYISVPEISVRNKIPSILHVTSQSNRLFALTEKTLFACALGDPFTWYRYEGTDADCYALDIAGFGDFTAIFSFGGVINIFRENSVTKLYGDLPSEFKTYEVLCDGVKKGYEDSVCIISDKCFYTSERGIMLYNGSSAVCISDSIKTGGIGKSVCTDKRCIYYSGKDSTYVFDTKQGGFFKESGTDFFSGFTTGKSAFCIGKDHITRLSGNEAITDGGFISFTEEQPGGEIVFGDFYLGTFEKKRLTRLMLRIETQKSSKITIFMSYDGGAFERAHEYFTSGKQASTVPVIPKPCDRYSIKITSDGYFRLEGMSQETSILK